MTPAAWLLANEHLLPRSGTALDVACGRGRHALWLASRGMATHAVDRDPDAVAFAREEALRRGLVLETEVLDLEGPSATVAAAAYDVIVVFHYLHRPLFPALLAALRPGGTLVYETFTTAQAARGKPSNPAFLLQPGELLQLVRPLEILRARG